MKKYFFNVIFFVFLFFGSLGFNTEIKNDDFEKNKIISNETRVDTISEGQTQIFDSNNVAGNGSNYFEGEFYYLSNIHNETNITYSYQFSLTNVFYYSEINNVINNIELLIYEVDGSGNLIYNSSVNYDSISIGIYEEYLSAENSFTFDESKNIAVKFSVTYDTSLVDESEYIYLSSLDSIVEPKITNINLQENYTTNEYTLDYVLTGDKSLITKIDFFDNDISNTLVQDVDYEILEYDSENTSIPIKIKFLNLSSNTIYDTLKINLTYSTNFSAEGKSFQYNIPTFGTKSENLESAVSIQASNPTSNSIFLDLDVNLSGIQTATLTNIAIKDATTTIKSYDVNLFNETLQLSTTIDSLNKNTTYN